MRYLKQILKQLKRLLLSRRFKIVVLVSAGLFLAVNAGASFIYKNRTYPNTSINKVHLGAVKSSEVSGKLSGLNLLPNDIELTGNGKSTTASLVALGISLDTEQITAMSKRRHWLPVANFFIKHDIPLSLKLDEAAFKQGYNGLSQTFTQAPVDARLSLDNSDFVIKDEVEGRSLNVEAVKRTILEKIAGGEKSIELPIETVQPERRHGDLLSSLTSLKEQQSTIVTYTYKANTKQLTSVEISRLYEQKDATYELADNNISAVVVQVGAGFGIKVQNLSQAVQATKEAISTKKTTTITLVAVPPVRKSYRYCVNARGVETSYLPELEAKLAGVYGDPKGWSLGGRVAMEKAASGCHFTVWLSAADQMPSFGAICDSTWSCRVGNNVVINFDRWRYASVAWNDNGRTLDDYRSMVINHETGHWFGFGHKNCGGAGQLAPVMQQQSIDLQGCQTNPWPLDSELSALETSLGI